MASATRLYRVVAALAAIALAIVAGGLAVAAGKSTFALPAPDALAAACRQLLPSRTSLLGLSIVVLAVLGVAVLVRAARAAWKQIRAERGFRKALHPCDQLEVAGTQVTVLDDPAPKAFCAGYLRPRINLSTAALARLSEAEL